MYPTETFIPSRLRDENRACASLAVEAGNKEHVSLLQRHKLILLCWRAEKLNKVNQTNTF